MNQIAYGQKVLSPEKKFLDTGRQGLNWYAVGFLYVVYK